MLEEWLKNDLWKKGAKCPRSQLMFLKKRCIVSKKSTYVYEKRDAKCPRSLLMFMKKRYKASKKSTNVYEKKRCKASKKSTDVYEKEIQSVQEVYWCL